MGTTDDVKAAYREDLSSRGEKIIIRRYFGTGTSRPWVDAVALATVTGYQPEELIGQLQQGDRKLVVLADDLVTARFPLPVRKDDKVIVRGKELNIEAVDDSTRRVSAALIALELRARG